MSTGLSVGTRVRFAGAVMLWIAVAVAGTPAPVQAQPASDAAPPNPELDAIARKHFETGLSYYDIGDYASAADEFEQAFALSERPELLYNVYLAREKLGQLAQAADSLALYLERVPNVPERTRLELHLDTLRKRTVIEAAAVDPAEGPSAQAPETVPPLTQAPAVPTAADAEGPTEESRPLRRNPWLWAAVGVVVTAAVVAGATAGGRGHTRTDAPFAGTTLGQPLDGPSAP